MIPKMYHFCALWPSIRTQSPILPIWTPCGANFVILIFAAGADTREWYFLTLRYILMEIPLFSGISSNSSIKVLEMKMNVIP